MEHWLSGFQDDIRGKMVETKVVGVTFENRQSIIREMRVGERVILRREPHNCHDRNAIRVDRETGEQVGYIARHEAAGLARFFDTYGQPVSAVVTAIVGDTYHDSSLGVRIQFTVPDVKPNGDEFTTLDWEEFDDDRF